MKNIIPISDLKNYDEVLRKCESGDTVYLTKNGRSRYVIQSLEEYEKQKATIQLLTELAKGVELLRKDGGLSLDEAFAGLEG